MNIRTKIILPIIVIFLGIVSIFIGRQGQVNADIYSQSGSVTLYVLLTAAGFLLIAVAAIIALFMIASSETKK
ncbi:hypothetical protein CO019_00630 [Candidatus Berkelbacteria bacterium CG_4_9_14_0_2_um_filter_42_30]|uniref:Uncharacterized protein n=6 Tax=Candidatus Berkelbacteria TaxID=1618330 RepID=A0A2M7K162_9BACT|nr:MAG: hypothetical protein AUJ40_02945 [Candidatus Berkelbacteria bacterium CG1_02_42_45]PIP51075.1 MAG: hypothetical protein COX11_00500 [Candidatus Berkelbacteria bacterium CG23_combo_of_CG06-09_8_20_14_all_41_73]PIR27435.1 MAG: hypothetical protein COV40_00835 [Candidatus Berkelbacteria bacterium CG11_big_fil_rev_8_21_14_0_20_42_15]PIX29965.1 MAG: hypothetical protein COZ63_02310 [Candidatus Berkelbacteria bacterium CG_4_8_14_3_um_filter_42_13]PIZ27503.1 MAG: hypothetical protein COY45_021